MITLLHPIWKHLPKEDWATLFNNVERYNQFNGKLVRMAEQIRNGDKQYVSRKGNTDLDRLGSEFFGDVFEGFLEYWMNKFGPSVGVDNYKVVTVNDWGVDGIGIGNDGNPIAVQIKARSDGQSELKGHKDHLDNFIEDAFWSYGIDPKSKISLLIVTNAKRVNFVDIVHRWEGRVSYISPNFSFGTLNGKKYSTTQEIKLNSIKQFVDGVASFWNGLRTTIESL